MVVTSDQKITLYGVARAALRRHRQESGLGAVASERVAVQLALAWAMPILNIEPEPELTNLIVADVINNNGDVPEARLDKLLDYARTLEEMANVATRTIAEQDALLEKLMERLTALIGSSITNDNGVQVTVVVPKGIWTSLQRLLDPEADDG